VTTVVSTDANGMPRRSLVSIDAASAVDARRCGPGAASTIQREERLMVIVHVSVPIKAEARSR
jgi:hypothetical protein